MNYKLRGNFSLNANEALQEILINRGVSPQELDSFMNPSRECEYSYKMLNNIEKAAKKLLEHLKKDSNILMIVD